MSDDWEREASDEPVEDSSPTPLDSEADGSDTERSDELPDTAPLPYDDVPTAEAPAEDSRAWQNSAPYQWNHDDVVWPVMYGDPLPDPSAPIVQSKDETGEFAVYGEETTDTTPPALDISAGAPEERAPVELVEPPSFSRWLLNLVVGASPEEQQQRLERLNHAISEYPELPANYVIRGELYLTLGERAQAVADFRTALELADTQLEIRDWGIVAQTMRDRALVGLRRAGWRGVR